MEPKFSWNAASAHFWEGFFCQKIGSVSTCQKKHHINDLGANLESETKSMGVQKRVLFFLFYYSLCRFVKSS